MDFERFLEFLETPAARIVILLATVAILCALAGYSVGKIRQMFREGGANASDMITNFRELHSRGAISDEEYRNIKARLAKQLQKQFDKRPKAEAPVDVEFEGIGDDLDDAGRDN